MQQGQILGARDVVARVLVCMALTSASHSFRPHWHRHASVGGGHPSCKAAGADGKFGTAGDALANCPCS